MALDFNVLQFLDVIVPIKTQHNYLRIHFLGVVVITFGTVGYKFVVCVINETRFSTPRINYYETLT